ncbi:MAG: GGDEF domain-containing protein [Gammaproteobacteria bacterium]|nr:GGDEF domain-containing protein [Gammaproteobacteria bacterium]MDH3449833.1 GGDEF domain-containing protein [Gammaproteobacteria bacterium]
MSQTTQLVTNQKSGPQAPAQVIALDPRSGNSTQGNRKHIRILQLSDLLSRHLEVGQIIEAFMSEIASDVPHCGYRFHSEDANGSIEQGVVEGFAANYRLKIQNRMLGELSLFKRSRFNSQELCELEDMLCALIYPVKNALMYEIALKSAYRDPLTGLSNRTSMEKNLPREVDLAKRHSQSMAILVMDLDGFKEINDTHGHDLGDQVLREVAEVISQVVRNTDLVYRYGGDEFVGGLAQTDIHGAIDVSERIRSSIHDLDLTALGISGNVQVSIGITLVRRSDNFLSAFKRADKALYQAKINGKNQIIIC